MPDKINWTTYDRPKQDERGWYWTVNDERHYHATLEEAEAAWWARCMADATKPIERRARKKSC